PAPGDQNARSPDGPCRPLHQLSSSVRMGTKMTRGRWPGLTALSAAVAAGCVTAAAGRGPVVVAPQQPEERRVVEPPRRSAAGHGPMRAMSCPLPARIEGSYDLSKLPIFSKPLFYTRANHPQDVAPRARELLVGALE